jgi:hypothetical protein
MSVAPAASASSLNTVDEIGLYPPTNCSSLIRHGTSSKSTASMLEACHNEAKENLRTCCAIIRFSTTNDANCFKASGSGKRGNWKMKGWARS